MELGLPVKCRILLEQGPRKTWDWGRAYVPWRLKLLDYEFVCVGFVRWMGTSSGAGSIDFLWW